MQLERDMVMAELAPLLTDPRWHKMGQNLKYDYQVLRRAGLEIRGVWCDTMIASYLLNPVRSSHGLDSLALEFLDHRMISYAEVAGTGKDEKNFADVDLEKASTYACEDADAAFLLHRLFVPRVEELEKGWRKHLEDLK